MTVPMFGEVVNESPLMPTLPVVSLADAVGFTADVLTDVLDVQETSPVASHAAAVVWGLVSGQLRGRVPLPVPYDLLMAGVSASIRWTEYLNRYRMTPMDPGTGAVQQSSDLQFTGFTLSELIVLWRYRVRTA